MLIILMMIADFILFICWILKREKRDRLQTEHYELFINNGKSYPNSNFRINRNETLRRIFCYELEKYFDSQIRDYKDWKPLNEIPADISNVNSLDVVINLTDGSSMTKTILPSFKCFDEANTKGFNLSFDTKEAV